MAGTAAQADPRLIAFMLPGIPASVPIARSRIRAALGLYELGRYADDAAAITSELVTNALQHACKDDTETIVVILARTTSPDTVTVVVKDPSPQAPVKRPPSPSSEQGRGLRIVDELSARWGWEPENGGKAVYAVLPKEAG